MEYWFAVIDEAFPIRYVAIGLIGFCILFFAGDRVHEAYVEGSEVVEEIVHVIEPVFNHDSYVPEKHTPVVYAVGQDTNRVRLQ